MWDQNELGGSSFSINGWRLQVDPARKGIGLHAAHDSSATASGSISLVSGDLPAVTEMFVRGDELHIAMPQQERDDVGLNLVFLIIEAFRDCLVIESTLSVQTSCWDSHPGLQFDISGEGSMARHYHGSAQLYRRSPHHQPSAIQTPTLSVLVDERDYLSIDSSGAGVDLRFFGEFMERGVIRKAQPWWVWSSAEPNHSQLTRLVKELAQRPLPLAS